MVKQDALQAVENGRRLIEEAQRQYEQAAQERMAEEKARIAEKWEPHLKAILEKVPTWAHPMVTTPDREPEEYDDGCWLYRPIVINVPETGMIYAYDFKMGVRFVAVKYAVQDDDEQWLVTEDTRFYRHQDEDDSGSASFDVALVIAYENFQQKPEMQRQADARNAERAAAQGVPKITSLNDWGVGEWTKEAISSWQAGEGQQAIAAALLALVELQRQRF